jgi:hypothetical protein
MNDTTVSPRKPWQKKTWVRVTSMIAALALVIGATVSVMALTGSHTTIIRPAANAAPATPKATPKTAPKATPTQPPQVIINNNPPAQPAPGPAVYVPAPAPAISSGYTYAGDGVWAGPDTSAAFALAVHQAWVSSGYASTVEAYSPVTGQWYTMTQAGSAPYVFIGGNNASVEFWS